ncbi:hypothetical protein BDB00DRAFT_206145 [Zychaea mexicana]|uniref:uncharacterized protein n=1 Tax=Zychaea mexicana TaxID=64656 RepID=UPI0022FDF826|nr:uncharacterized protein BDB00DRAFT_206145 [Zychaea mexicana]KAI9495586.1 hypothetical protein BDB00DRAFT_206145 [Zychaea mexicana]
MASLLFRHLGYLTFSLSLHIKLLCVLCAQPHYAAQERLLNEVVTEILSSQGPSSSLLQRRSLSPTMATPLSLCTSPLLSLPCSNSALLIPQQHQHKFFTIMPVK